MSESVGCVKRTKGMLWCVARTLLACPILLLACLPMAVFFAGCGGSQGPERVVVSGTITYNGKPLPEGTIRFVPVQTSPVPTSGATIVNGNYKVDGKGAVPVGTHRVQIEAFRKVPLVVEPGRQASPHWPKEMPQQYLPRKFNADSQLEITIQPGSGPISKDFDLTD
jgi:hypothetical protein